MTVAGLPRGDRRLLTLLPSERFGRAMTFAGRCGCWPKSLGCSKDHKAHAGLWGDLSRFSADFRCLGAIWGRFVSARCPSSLSPPLPFAPRTPRHSINEGSSPSAAISSGVRVTCTISFTILVIGLLSGPLCSSICAGLPSSRSGCAAPVLANRRDRYLIRHRLLSYGLPMEGH